ncbi:glycosyltransferase [Dethiobacter alkaliphilus]|uniref:glycosyltransferase n=1 Tax=Dethiobacter alkaliphilus TaxID=427926 RepID=UPI002226F1BC|nr:glycosyltransferase [Dethiobacter alkaliphilus]MCW3489270.1 hypothetical protein [Dethiobacter alkaliphilus]
MKKGISLCLMIDDQEMAGLETCLKSAAGSADEVIIVHEGTADEAAALAGEHKAQYFKLAWRSDFGAACNRALEQAAYSWAVCLEMDRELGKHLQVILDVTRILSDSGDIGECITYLQKNFNMVTPQALQAVTEPLAATGKANDAVCLLQEAFALSDGQDDYRRLLARILLLWQQYLLTGARQVFGALPGLTGKLKAVNRAAEELTLL